MRVPVISVLMPVAEEMSGVYLRTAIASVLAQTFTDFELIVYRDGPGALVDEIMRGVEDPRVSYLCGEVRVGEAAARNACLAAARGEWVAVHDADDVSDATRLGRQVGSGTASGASLCLSWCAAMDECGQVVFRKWYADIRRVRFNELTSMLQPDKRGVNLIAHGTALVRTADLRSLRGYSTQQAPCDYDLFLRILRAGLTVVGVPEVLYYHRVHSASLSRRWGAEVDAGRVWDAVCGDGE